MPNAYANVAEIRAGVPDGIRPHTTKYNALILRLASEVSRAIDGWCNRTFYPRLATRYFNGRNLRDLWTPDLISITSISYSEDDGETYSDLVSADYLATVAGDVNGRQSYNLLRVSNLSDTLSVWPAGQNSIRITGVWAYADDRDLAWESSSDTVENNPLSASGVSLIVNDVDAIDNYGALPVFSPGVLLRIENEYLETGLTIDTTSNTISITRGRNGTTAVSHAQNASIDIWRAPEPIRRACIIQTNRQMERGLQGFSDARAAPEIGPIIYSRQWDPEAMALMSPYRMRVFA